MMKAWAELSRGGELLRLVGTGGGKGRAVPRKVQEGQKVLAAPLAYHVASCQTHHLLGCQLPPSIRRTAGV